AVVAAGSVGGAFAASLFVAFLSVISGVGRGAGLHRVAGDLSVYGLRPTELVVPDARSILFAPWISAFQGHRLHGSNPAEAANCVGWLAIVLALAWLVVACRRRSRLDFRARAASVGFVVVVVVALALAAPSPVGIFGHLVTTPSRFLWAVIPAI